MAAADVFVFPSLFEGSAVVTYEALACGLPCVVTPEAGSVVRDGVEGLVVPSADVEAPGRGDGAARASTRSFAAAMSAVGPGAGRGVRLAAVSRAISAIAEAVARGGRVDRA